MDLFKSLLEFQFIKKATQSQDIKSNIYLAALLAQIKLINKY